MLMELSLSLRHPEEYDDRRQTWKAMKKMLFPKKRKRRAKWNECAREGHSGMMV